jgi:hypothetical protein
MTGSLYPDSGIYVILSASLRRLYMRKYVGIAALCLVLVLGAAAQEGFANDPATKQDVENYLAAVHSRELTKQTLQAMSKPMHQFIADAFAKDKDSLPPDFEQRMTKFMDDYFNNMPVDEIYEAVVPIYEKHFTKGDMQALSAFYLSPTGQKVLHEMPAISSESMTVMLPYLRRNIEKLQQDLQDQVAQMLKKPTDQKPTTVRN